MNTSPWVWAPLRRTTEWIDGYGYVLRVWTEDGKSFAAVVDIGRWRLLWMFLRTFGPIRNYSGKVSVPSKEPQS